MRVERELREHAKKLLSLSVEPGQGVTSERVAAVLETLRKHHPRRHRQLLKIYLRLVNRELRKYQAVVEHAGDVSKATLKQVGEEMSRRYGRTITAISRPNPTLIAGLRIRVGDDVYDSTVLGRLHHLDDKRHAA